MDKKLVFSLAGVALSLLLTSATAPAQLRKGGRSEAERILDRSRQALIEELRSEGLDPSRLGIELLGEPLVYPDHRSLHWSPPSEGPAAVRGRVTDSTGAVIPGAEVGISSPGREEVLRAVTDNEGRFSFEGVQPGPAEIEISSTGFRRHVYVLELEEGERRQLAPQLKVGKPTESITINGEVTRPKLPHPISNWGVTLPPDQFRPYQVCWHEEQVSAFRIEPEVSIDEIPISHGEYRLVMSALHEFYADALAIERGSSRFLPYISEDALLLWRWIIEDSRGTGDDEPYFPRGDFSDEDLKRWLAVLLEHVAHDAWSRFESLALPEYLDLTEDGGFDEVAGVMGQWLSEVDGELERRGAWSPPHLRAVTPYLRAVQGEGLLVKQESLPSYYPHRLGPVYKAVFAPYLYVYWDWRGNRLQIVHLIFAD